MTIEFQNQTFPVVNVDGKLFVHYRRRNSRIVGHVMSKSPERLVRSLATQSNAIAGDEELVPVNGEYHA